MVSDETCSTGIHRVGGTDSDAAAWVRRHIATTSWSSCGRRLMWRVAAQCSSGEAVRAPNGQVLARKR